MTHARGTVALCFVVAMIEGFDLQAAGVAAPLLGPAFHLDASQMGWFFSAATLGLIGGALIGGRVADRFGRKAGLVASLLLFGLCSVLTGLAWDFTSLVGARLLTGVGLGGALPNLIAIAAESARNARTASSVAAMYAGIPFGGSIAALVSVLGLHGGWSTIFLVGGAAPLLLRYLPDLRPAKTSAPKAALGALFGRAHWQNTICLWAGFFFSLLVLYLLLNWLPALLVARGVARSEAGIVQIVFNVAGAASSLLTGRAMDRFDPRKVVLLAFGGLIAALALLAWMPANFAFALLGGFAIGVTVVAVQAILYGLAPRYYAAEIRGTGVGAAVAAGRFGSVVGPLLAGTLVAAGRSSTDVLIGIVPIALLGGLATYLLVRRDR